jgi:hypothetical protein
MSREFFLAGIGGYRPDLCYNPMDDCCTVRFPGYDQTIAMLPSNTVDAVLTSKGLLVYRDSKGEVRALQLSDHEPIYQAAVAENVRECDAQKSAVTGMPFSKIMGRHAGGMVSPEQSGHGLLRSNGVDDYTTRIVIGKDACMKDGSGNNMMTRVAISNATISSANIPSIDGTKLTSGTIPASAIYETNRNSKAEFENFAAELVQEYIVPLVKNVQRVTALNAELASKVKELEKRLEDRTTVQPVAPAPRTDNPIRELSWGDQGGLPNFLRPQDNPFCGKRRG